MADTPFLREHAADHADELIAWFLGLSPDTAGRVSDLNVGSNLRVLFEAVGVRLEHLDNKAFLALQRAIPTVLFDFFGEGPGFPLHASRAASGLVRVVRRAGTVGDVLVPQGTRFQLPNPSSTAPRVYVTTVPVLLANGVAFAQVLVQSTTAGAIGNTPAATLQMIDAVAGIDTDASTNPAALINGADVETDESRRARFTQFIRELARAQEAGLEVGARTAQVVVSGVVTEQVVAARAITVPEKRGLVRLYIDNGGATASPALVTAAQTIVDGSRAADGSRIAGYKAAGIVVEVLAVASQVVPVTAQIVLSPGFDGAAVQPAVVTAIGDYLAGLGVFADLVLADLIATVVLVRGVYDVTVQAPTANVVAATGARIIPGVITVTTQ